MSSLDVDALTAPLAGDAPCGSDLEYDASFLALEEAARGKPEQQYGDTVIPAEPPDWRRVQQLALELCERTRDLRVGLHLVRATLNQDGLPALPAGLSLMQRLLAQHWDHVHPMLDVEDHNDPTMRMNALAPLADVQAVLADIRRASLSGRGSLSGRDIELASGKTTPEDGESVPSPEGVTQALRDADAARPGLIEAWHGMTRTLGDLDSLLAERGGLAAPDLKPLRLLVGTLADAAARAAGTPDTGVADQTAPADTQSAAAAATGVSAPGTIRSREDAIRTLQRVCEWIELNEPSNPAPLLIRRAQRLMTKSFVDIIRDLVPDGLDQIEKIAGQLDE